MLNFRKFLFLTGERMMRWAFILGLMLPVICQKLGLFEKVDSNASGFVLAVILGGIGFLLLLPITAPLLGFGWLLVRSSCLDSAND